MALQVMKFQVRGYKTNFNFNQVSMNLFIGNFSIFLNGMMVISDKMRNFDFQDLILNYFSQKPVLISDPGYLFSLKSSFIIDIFHSSLKKLIL